MCEFRQTRRTEAALHFIAQIMGQFDLVAPVELRDGLSDLGFRRAVQWRMVLSESTTIPLFWFVSAVQSAMVQPAPAMMPLPPELTPRGMFLLALQ